MPFGHKVGEFSTYISYYIKITIYDSFLVGVNFIFWAEKLFDVAMAVKYRWLFAPRIHSSLRIEINFFFFNRQ